MTGPDRARGDGPKRIPSRETHAGWALLQEAWAEPDRDRRVALLEASFEANAAKRLDDNELRRLRRRCYRSARPAGCSDVEPPGWPGGDAA